MAVAAAGEGEVKALLVALALVLTGCFGEDTKTAAKCAGARSMFSVSQDKVIDAGLCDAYDTVSDCPAHVALRESLILALSEAGCGS